MTRIIENSEDSMTGWNKLSQWLRRIDQALADDYDDYPLDQLEQRISMLEEGARGRSKQPLGTQQD